MSERNGVGSASAAQKVLTPIFFAVPLWEMQQTALTPVFLRATLRNVRLGIAKVEARLHYVMHPGLVIRSGKSEDANCLAVLASQVWLHTYATQGITTDIADYVLRELTPQQYRALLNDPTCWVVVAASGESLVGLAVAKFGVPCPAGNSHSCAELQTLYVQEHFWGCGVGKSLLRAAEVEAKLRSNGVLWLTVNAQNARAIAFYAHQGYTQVGTTYFVLGKGRHENHVLVGTDG